MRHFTAEYRLYVSGILIGRSYLQLSLSDSTYRLSAHIEPAGAGRLVGRSHVVSTTGGSLQNGRFVPERMDLSWTSDDLIKSSHMVYRDGAPYEFVSGYEQAEEFKSKNPVDIATVGPGSLDPFIGMISPLGGKQLKTACDDTRRIFDGRRLSRWVSGKGTHLTPREHGFKTTRPAVKCDIVWQPIGGYSDASLERAEDLPPVAVHFMQIPNTDFAAPLNLRGSSRFGRVTIYAVRYFTESKSPPTPFNIAVLAGLE